MSTFPFPRTISDRARAIFAPDAHFEFYPPDREIPRAIMTTPPMASHPGEMPALSIISRTLYGVYKTAVARARKGGRRGEGLRLAARCHGRERLRDEELFLPYFRVTSSAVDCGDRPPRAYLWIEFARFPGKLVFLPYLSHPRTRASWPKQPMLPTDRAQLPPPRPCVFGSHGVPSRRL